MAHRPKPFFVKSRQLWYVQIDGRQHNLGPDEAAAQDRYYELMAARNKAEPAPVKKTTWAVVAILEEFMKKFASKTAPRTFEHYRRFLKSFRLSIKQDLTIDELAPGHVTDWIHGHSGWSPSTQHGGIHAVKKAIKWGCKQWKLGPSPLADVPAPSPTRREAVILPDQWPHVVEACTDQQFKDLLTFMWETGARPQEAVNVEARHYDAASKLIQFPREESKGKKLARVIYLTDEAVSIVERLTKQWPTGKLFRNENDLPWNRNAIRCRFRRQRLHSRVKVKVKGICGYAIRHSFATNALRAGIDPITLAVLMGHVDASMIANTYQHLATDPQYLRAAVNRALRGKAG